jgi:hypothetical protein
MQQLESSLLTCSPMMTLPVLKKQGVILAAPAASIPFEDPI